MNSKEKLVKKERTIRIKDKDLELFNFIARFGFATVNQIHAYLGNSINSLKTRLSHLVNDGYLVNHRIFFNRPSVYTITKKSNLTALNIVQEINLRDYLHNTLVTEIFLKIKDDFVDYTTERMLRAERGIGVGKSGRIPDLIGHTYGEQTIAIEVDRTDKGHDRLGRIIEDYKLNIDYSCVWFFARNDFIYNNLSKAIDGNPKFKIFKIKNVLV